MKKVIVVSKTHLDLGFTDFAENIKKRYINEFIPGAAALAEKVNTANKKNFVWTTGSWILREALLNSDDKTKENLVKALEDGNIVPHALPFTTHTELMDSDTLKYGLSIVDELDVIRGRKTISAKMTDVPGHTKAIVTHLAEKGVKLLHIGVNGASAIPDVPECFLWKNNKSEVVVIYSASYGGAYKSKFLEEVLYFDHTLDNHGAPSPEVVLNKLSKIKAEFPGYDVGAGTLDDYAELIWEKRSLLPVVDSEIGDTWIHGSTADVYKAGALRTLINLKEKWISDGSLLKNSEEHKSLNEGILCLSEHTCGMDSKMFLADYENYLKKDFTAARKRDIVGIKHPLRGFPTNLRTIKYRKDGTYFEGSYRNIEKSWEEQRAYIDKAVNSLNTSHKQEATAELSKLRPVKKQELSGEKYDNTSVSFGGWVFKLNEFGGIQYLSLSGNEIIKENNEPVMEYRAYSKGNYDWWHTHYSRDLKETKKWVYGDFGRPLLKYAEGKYKKGRFFYKKEKSVLLENENELRILVNLKCEKALCEEQGAPRDVQITYTLNSENIKIDVFWYNKDANRLTEALFMHLYPSAKELLLEKSGEFINPFDVVANGSRNLHITRRALFNKEDLAFEFVNLTAPLISVGWGKILEFDNRIPDLEKGVSYVLYNNVWGTNFPLWYEENAHFEFIIKKSAAKGSEENELS